MENAFENFKGIIDTYFLNYMEYDYGKVAFECDYGELIFLKTRYNVITIYGIYFFPEYRQQGLCREILHYLIDIGAPYFKFLCVQTVLSNILHDYLLRFQYKNKNFLKYKDGFYYKL